MIVPAFRNKGEELQCGDLVAIIGENPRDVGVITTVYEQHPDLEWCVDVLWEDGIFTQNAEDLMVIQ